MSIQYSEITENQESPELLKGCLWALGIGAALVTFTLTTYIGIQRAEIAIEQRKQREVEDEVVAIQREKDAVRQQDEGTINMLNDRLAKAETARLDAEAKARSAEANAARVGASISPLEAVKSSRPAIAPPSLSAPEPVFDAAKIPGAPMPADITTPSAQEITNFIKLHLFHMTGPVEAQLADYADAQAVDFHEKTQATLKAIETDRRAWVQKWPVRVIFINEIQPQIAITRDAANSWVASATFDWRWQFKSRSGTVAHGVTRDTWKIIPWQASFRIVSEHTVDPATGQLKD
jgi:hypothetical protein